MNADAGLSDVDKIEMQLLLEGIFLRYGYDFRGYAMPTVARRLTQFTADNGLGSFSEVTRMALRDLSFFHRLLACFSVSVTSLFRDPVFYRALQEKVIPSLRSWPHIKAWHAGCATGEEVYSHAILLKEAGLLERSTLYATDISQAALDTGKAGIYSLPVIRKGIENYRTTGAANELSEHYHARYEAAIMHPDLRRRVMFAKHNLAMDASFGEMQIIVCRNVLIYFNEDLQNQVLTLFLESLEYGGYLCLGDKESLTFSAVAEHFETVDEAARIYKKKSGHGASGY
jgi:chemotaxis protein methyltransferase CheR